MSKSSAPKVSVIVPNYNHARFLRQRLDSILHQTFQDFEIILLDDCSADDSRAILSEYGRNPRVRLEFNEENSGSTFKQWSKGVKLARGEYIWIAESDDFADQRLLEELVSRLDHDPTVALVNCRSWRVTEGGEIIGYLDSPLAGFHAKRWTEDFHATGREECEKYLVRCCTVLNASSVLFRKEIYERVAGVDQTMRMCGDWKLWAAMALEGRIAHVGGKPLNYYREHERSVTKQRLQEGIYSAESLDVVRWILERVTPTEVSREKLCEDLFSLWHQDVLTTRVPFRRRCRILANAMAIDRHALRRLAGPGLTAVRLTVGRRWRSFRAGVLGSSKFGKSG